VDPETIEASYGAGVLHLTMKKRAEVLPKRITVQAK
jgi:HSP20 family molecular chaperone IbpA